jgi:hypothetical protein
VAWRLRRETPRFQRRALASMAVAVACVVVAAFAGVSTSSHDVNSGAVALGFLAAAVLGMSAFRLRPTVVGVALGGLAGLLLCAGLVLGTAGAIAVVFVVEDSEPLYTSSTPDHRSCWVTSFGNATTSESGYDVRVERGLPFMPFIEFAVDRRRFTNPSFDPREACRRALS